MSKAVAAIKAEIARKQAEIGALKKALTALGAPAAPAGRGNRKPRSEAQKKKISAALKKAWAERKKAEKKSAA
jgi:hypothetical protein